MALLINQPRFFALVLCIALSIGAPLSVADGTREPEEYQLKAAYLYKFLAFTEWPTEAFETPDAPFVLCVVGKDPFGQVLDALAELGEVDGRPITIARIPSVEAATRCHLLFVANSEAGQLESILTDSRLVQSCLTVSDLPGFVEAGGGIELLLKDRRVKFRVNLDATRSSGLEIRSQMLRLAEEILDSTGLRPLTEGEAR